MADRKITDLTALTTPASADVLPIVDVSEAAAADKNKKVTVGELFKGIPDGTAAAPAIAFESDDGNGLFLSTTDTIGIATNGVSRATVSTTAVTSTLPVIVPDGSAAAPSVAFTGSGTDTGIYSPGADQVAISTNGTGRLFVDANGSVRINSSIQATSNGGLNVEVTSNGTSSVPFALLNRGTSNNTGAYLAFRGLSSASAETDYAYIQMLATDTSSRNGALAFWTTNSGSPSEKLRITADGKVGIGTSTVNAKVQIEGSDAAPAASGNMNSGIVYQSGAGARAINIGVDNTNQFAWINSAYTNNSGTATDTGLRLMVGAQSALTIDSSRRVGIGTNSPGSYAADASNLVVGSGSGSEGITIAAGTTGWSSLYFADGTTGTEPYRGFVDYGHTDDVLRFGAAGSERARIDSSGRLLVGTSSTSAASRAEFVGNSSSSTGSGVLRIRRGSDALFDGNEIAILTFGDTISGGEGRAVIGAYADGTGGTGDLPTRLVFSTTADGASSPTERMRITSAGTLRYGQTTTDDPPSANVSGIAFASTGRTNISTDDLAPLGINRKTSDGNLVIFHQDGVNEGTISVSGTTVSYNGAHLSRWSQLPSGAERIEILRGTVLSNIDEMCEWGEEDNEQLNRMKVSDVEGDKNVSGVFQAWDDDDDTYADDFYCAMTGDFIIRIAQGVTVERGDLLMSAGDGTAKPQDDDIIRSKTIAKVTSTNVTCTYEDGSYCVPCVLMAC